ncbi:MAG: tRNA uridine-5-carboxymethylaminomethyl(34) synthesis GTPase MnmE [Proteobacteria bacterium]|nr:tRNA uridine-5-carboxymethylaminomethyl(34) synthesis GTPase MnmE [Pseudomonadota bacterium]
MSLSRKNDTIAAICTAVGEGGVAIVRVSGPKAKEIGRALFSPANPTFREFRPHTLHFGTLVETGGITLDEGLTVFMPGPHSYTGEDTVEFHTHGGQAAPTAVLEAVLACGARLAERGEFTLRAFLTGRLDLTQAEAVAELIHAPTKAALHLAQTKLSGALGRRIAALRHSLEDLRRQLCLAVDFPEDEVECLPLGELCERVDSALAELDRLLSGMDRARAWREGAMAVLCGRVNAGKSSLLNALLGKNRAIVTDTPGTTRDYLEEAINFDGLLVRVVDTAGLRQSADAVETAGMEMSRELADQADLVLFVADGSLLLTSEELEVATGFGPERTLVVVNKADLPSVEPDVASIFEEHWFTTVPVSATTGQGLMELGRAIRRAILAGMDEPDPDEAVPNLRQAEALRRTRAELLHLRQDAGQGIPPDLLGVALETACAQLGSLLGEITPEEILHSIFDSFCIGK